MTTPSEVVALIRAIARGEAPPVKKRRYEAPRVVSRPARHTTPKPQPAAPLPSPLPVVEQPLTTFGTAAAAEVLANARPPEPKFRPAVDPVIAATAAHVEEKRAHTFAAEAQRAQLIKAGNWKGNCQARDAESGLRCGLLAGHLVGTAKEPARKHRTARGVFERCLPEGASPSRSRELEQWAQDRRDVGDVAP